MPVRLLMEFLNHRPALMLRRVVGVAISLAVSLAMWLAPALPAHAAGLGELLQSPTHVLLMRHANAPGVGDPAGYSLERCETQRVLDEAGRQQSVRIGDWLRGQGVRSARVLSSVWCRCTQTAELLKLGPVRVEPTLGSFFDTPEQGQPQTRRLQQVLLRELATKGREPLVLVTHQVNITALTGEFVAQGGMVLVQSMPDGRWAVVGRYPSP